MTQPPPSLTFIRHKLSLSLCHFLADIPTTYTATPPLLMFILNTLHTLLLTASSLVSYVRRYLPATSLLTSVLVYSVPASWTLTLLLGVLSLPLSVRFSFSFNNHTDPYLDTVVQSRLEFMALQQAATKQYIRELFGKWQQVQF